MISVSSVTVILHFLSLNFMRRAFIYAIAVVLLFSFYGCSKEKEKADPFENGYEYVDLGLSVKWATCNVGATKPEEYGDYYAWGEIETKTGYSWANYKYRSTGDSPDDIKFKKYSTDRIYGINDCKSVLESDDDVARVKWGGKWRMPTESERDELYHKCKWIWTTVNGVSGYVVTSKLPGFTDRSIFLPAAGFKDETGLHHDGSFGAYWSSSLVTDCRYVWYLNFDSENIQMYGSLRYYGFSIRPVCK